MLSMHTTTSRKTLLFYAIADMDTLEGMAKLKFNFRNYCLSLCYIHVLIKVKLIISVKISHQVLSI